jgi:tRNA A-37 threonylcarbamoyl transferase component Bud32
MLTIRSRLESGFFTTVDLAEERTPDHHRRMVALKSPRHLLHAPLLKREQAMLMTLGRRFPWLRMPQIFYSLWMPTTRMGAFVMEYLDGVLLSTVLRKAPSRTIIALIDSLLAEVACFHEQGVTHGDLHSKNVLIREGNAYLLDFATAQWRAEPDDFAYDCHCLYQLIVFECHPRMQRLCPALAVSLSAWQEALQHWRNRDPTVTAHHLLVAWRCATPHWLALVDAQRCSTNHA